MPKKKRQKTRAANIIKTLFKKDITPHRERAYMEQKTDKEEKRKLAEFQKETVEEFLSPHFRLADGNAATETAAHWKTRRIEKMKVSHISPTRLMRQNLFSRTAKGRNSMWHASPDSYFSMAASKMPSGSPTVHKMLTHCLS